MQLRQAFRRLVHAPMFTSITLLTFGYWQRRFGEDPGIIGKRILMDGQAREVIGVLPRNFRLMDVDTSILLPLQLDRGKTFVGNFSYRAIARLKPGATLTQANE